MDSATQDLLLQKLEELIIDEEKIVTVISASELLNISVQDATKLLQTFAEDQTKTASKVASAYILSGVLKDGNLGVRLVKEHELKDKKDLFKTVSSQVLYSLQKSDSIDVYNVVAVNGFDASAAKESPMAGSLTSKNCALRTVKPKSLPKPEAKKPVIKGKSSFFIKSASAGDAESKQDTTKPQKEEVKGKGSLFTKSASTGNSDNKKNKESSKNDSKQTSKSKANGGIASFFNKMPAKSAFTQKTSTDSQKNFSSESQTSVESSENNKPASDDEQKPALKGIEECFEEEEPMVVDVDKEVPSQQSEKSKVASTPSNKSNKSKRQRSTSKKNDKPSKRRKRIKEIVKSDSDSDDMFADNTEEIIEDVINNSDDEQQPIVKHKIESPPPVKNKRRKLVDKTYEDEEGFIITSKEWVYESGSEDEKEQKDPAVNVTSQEKNVAPSVKPKKEVSPPVAGNNKGKKGKKNGAANQPTLMSFFKKA